MNISLNPAEYKTLMEILEAKSEALRDEIRHTELREFKLGLRDERRVVEDLMEKIRTAGDASFLRAANSL